MNGVSKIFPDLYDLNKYILITTIHFMVDDVEGSRYFQTNGFKKFGVPYYLTLKLVSKHSIDSLLQATQKIIIIYNKDWHNGVTYQNSLGTFSFSPVSDKKLSFSSNIYLLSLLLDQLSLGQSISIQSKIKDLLKMENIGTNHKGYIYVYASDNLCCQINKLVSNRDRVRNTKMKYAQNFCLDSYREIGKNSLSTFYS